MESYKLVETLSNYWIFFISIKNVLYSETSQQWKFFSSHVNQISGGITIVKVGGNQSPTDSNITRTTQTDSNGRNSRLILIKFTHLILNFS